MNFFDVSIIARFVCLLLVLVSSLPETVYARSEPAVKAPTILVLGDSLSAAYGIPQHKGWVSLLRQRLKQKSFQYQVVNASISGDTTANAIQRIRPLLAEHKPAIVIIEMGGNDGLRGLSIKHMKRNLADMIALSRQSEAKILLTGIKIPPNYGRKYTEAFYNVYVELSKQFQVSMVPFLLNAVGDRAGLMQGDGLHPTAEAQQIILENVWPFIQTILTS